MTMPVVMASTGSPLGKSRIGRTPQTIPRNAEFRNAAWTAFADGFLSSTLRLTRSQPRMPTNKAA